MITEEKNMKTSKKWYGIILLILCFFMNMISITAIQNPINQSISQYQYNDNIVNGSIVQYEFQQQTRLQYYGNVSTSLNMSCDADNIGEQNISINYYAQNQVELQIRLNASNNPMELTYKNRIRVQNGSLYEYRYMIICNISRNTTDTMITQLRLQIQEQDRNSTWAWYNITSGEFECLQSWYENEELIANTTHFTTFVVLSGIEVSENILPLWIYIIIICSIGLIIIIILIIDPKKQCKNGKNISFYKSCKK